MTLCTARTFLLTVCTLQMLATIQREVFDFLGYMWAPIIGNFFQMICVIFGIFGIYHFRPKYLAVESDILNLGTGSRSWWTANGIGCKLISNYSAVTELEKNSFSTPPSSIEGCLLQYYYVECLQAAVQCLLAFFGFAGAAYVIYVYTEEDDSSTRRNNRGLPYSIEYNVHGGEGDADGTPYQRPMTPRKVKRRSTRSKRGSYRRSYYQNPVTKIMNQSAAAHADTSSIDSYHLHNHKSRRRVFQPPPPPGGVGIYPGHANPSYAASPSSSLNYLNTDVRAIPIYVNDSETVI